MKQPGCLTDTQPLNLKFDKKPTRPVVDCCTLSERSANFSQIPQDVVEICSGQQIMVTFTVCSQGFSIFTSPLKGKYNWIIQTLTKLNHPNINITKSSKC